MQPDKINSSKGSRKQMMQLLLFSIIVVIVFLINCYFIIKFTKKKHMYKALLCIMYIFPLYVLIELGLMYIYLEFDFFK